MSEHITIGMDLGDLNHIVIVLDDNGKEICCSALKNSKVALRRFFQSYPGAKVAIEAGTHSPWISRFLQQLGCQVYVSLILYGFFSPLFDAQVFPFSMGRATGSG